MKKYSIILVASTAFLWASLAAQDAGRVTLDYSSYQFYVPYDIGSATAGSTARVFVGKAATDLKDERPFGLILRGRGKELMSTPLFEVRDAGTKKAIKRITVEEYFGKTDAGWKRVDAGSVHTADRASDVFTFMAGGVNYLFGRTLETETENGAPFGKQLKVSFTLGADKEAAVSLHLLGAAGGILTTEGSNCWIGDAQNQKESQAYIVINLGSGGMMALGPKPKAGQQQTVTFESKELQLKPGELTVALGFTIVGTSVGSKEHALRQVQNYLSLKKDQKKAPQVVAVTSVSKPSTASGDTVTYSIMYCNIGTAPAADITIDNPVPAGTHYLEKSAEGEGSEINVVRSATEVASVTWKFTAPIMPGERRVARFSVTVL